ncbi:tRNA lysidine(34) synthetase TilS [Aquabacterium parvum]|uniref:tRNA lysidine(34) synthetase TilS n=1 Tax=Aquabacterium parvum TaxID=70584 RepID=UPI000718B371|nr:tRNA lysidine(34) synthetase TilS [Aquabacterium parvum]MBU0917714.1 tRNA lysidine(34) synthetase TilS [Gammaproteobacteria bacterium]
MPALAVAYSCGRDSTALLHVTARAAAQVPGMHVFALHVHHGLSPHADAWLAHAEATCRQWADQGLPVSLLSRRVSISLDAGLSVEAEARRLRHEALVDMAREAGVDLLLLAQHRRDQAETFLLQALRGGGVAGLASMPKDDWRDGVRWVRPWLDLPREAVEAYALQHDLRFVDDESNGDRRFARNRLRLDVWPALLAAFPDAEVTLTQSAARVADALPALRAWQADALQRWGGEAESGALNAVAWSAMPDAERRQVLLAWLGQHGVGGASWIDRLSHEVPRALAGQGSARWPELGVSLYRGVLRCVPDGGEAGGAPGETDGFAPRPAVVLSIDRPGDWPVPGWRGCLRVEEVSHGGVAPQRLQSGLQARARSGGEGFQMGAGRPVRDLKRQFQSAGVPAWARSAPLFFSGESLVFVPGLGVDGRFQAPRGVLQWGLRWLPDA